MRFGSICSGIEAASVAWQPLGWEPAWYSEIDPFASAVLEHHHPGVDNLGDLTTILDRGVLDERQAIDLLVAGTPCQSFSVAGLRRGLDDERGNLAFEFLRLARETRPRWLVWENVKGAMSTHEGRDFAAIIGGMVEIGYGVCWRRMDAQYVRVEPFPRAVPQRRDRVFVVGHLGDWRPSAAVLFEPEGLQRHTPPRREAGSAVAALTASGVGTCGADDNQAQAGHIIAFGPRQADILIYGDKAGPLDTGIPPVSVATHLPEVACTLDAAYADKWGLEDQHINGGAKLFVQAGTRIRRLTPLECERIMGFPDGYTLIDYKGNPSPDLHRYRVLGNSMCVNVMIWIGARINLFKTLCTGT